MKKTKYLFMCIILIAVSCKKSSDANNGTNVTPKQDIVVVPVNHTITTTHISGTSYFSANYELKIMHDSGSFYFILFKDTLATNRIARFSMNNNAIHTEYSCSGYNFLWDHVSIGDKIDGNASWQTYGFGCDQIPGQTQGYITPGSGDKYIGFRFFDHSTISNRDYYKYGWIKVNYASDAKSLFVKEYAYNNQFNKGLKAGEK